MSNCKVGDEVQIIECNNGAPEQLVGKVGRVMKVHPEYLDVKVPTESCVWGFSPNKLRLINRTPDLYPNETLDICEKTGQVATVTIGGTKHDNGKPALSLVPYELLVETAKAMQFGANKYGRDNYRKGFESYRLIDAALRHIHAWNEGEDLDPESRASHLGHAAACLGMLLGNIEDKTLTDTRRKRK